MLGFSLLLATASSVRAQESLEVEFNTTETGGDYAPRNIVAVWIEDSQGAFVKTIGRWANRRIQYLLAWSDASGQDTDAVSGATRSSHEERLTVVWDLTDRNDTPVADGTYVVRMELADSHPDDPSGNHQGEFEFVLDHKGRTEETRGGGFENVTMTYTAATPTEPELCGNEELDLGETCDPRESCPTSCEPAAEECVQNVLIGRAEDCNAECVAQAIRVCVDEDGCCPSACTSDTDSDCSASSSPTNPPDDSSPQNPLPSDPATEDPANDNRVVGGCQTVSSRGGEKFLPAWLLIAFVCFGFRRSGNQSN